MDWKNIITKTILKDSILLKLEEIKHALLSYKNPQPEENLLGGDLGIAMFFLYYYKLTNDAENLHIAEKMILNVYKQVNSKENILFSFAGGLSGVCWFTEFSKNHRFLDIEAYEISSDIDDVLANYMLFEIQRGNYDYMHGALGMGLYFLQKKDFTKNKKHIFNLIKFLDKISIIDADKKYRRWNYYHKGVLINGSNLGLSHGIPSILSFLVKCYNSNLALKATTKQLIYDTVKCLLINIQDPAIYKTYYAYSVEEGVKNQHDTRLAWCYGDLGVCCALWQAATFVINDNYLQRKIIEIMKFNAKRISLVENMVDDAGLCHGTVGIAHIFNRFYQDTKIKEFKDASIYWYGQTMQIAKFEDGLAGYKTCISNATQNVENCSGLLEGVAGIGLALISAVSSIEPHWDECLLIS